MKETKEISIPLGFKFKEEKPGFIIIEKTITPEERFKKLIKGLTIDFDEEYHDSTLFTKDGLVVFEFEFEKLHLWVNYSTFWTITKFLKENISSIGVMTTIHTSTFAWAVLHILSTLMCLIVTTLTKMIGMCLLRSKLTSVRST